MIIRMCTNWNASSTIEKTNIEPSIWYVGTAIVQLMTYGNHPTAFTASHSSLLGRSTACRPTKSLDESTKLRSARESRRGYGGGGRGRGGGVGWGIRSTKRRQDA